MFGLTRLRIVEVGIALLLTLAALLFVGFTVWAKDVTPIETRESERFRRRGFSGASLFGWPRLCLLLHQIAR